jgi:hypothetical protein
MPLPDYRPYLPKPEQSKLMGPTARAHVEGRRKNPRVGELLAGWKKALEAPFRGVTTDGTPLKDVFALRPEGAPTETIIVAVNALLGRLPPEIRARMSFPVDSAMWRSWQNTEMYFEDYGLRLEEVSPELREAAMAVVRASLSAKGYQVSRDVMRLNAFLGDLVGGPGVLGEWSFNFCLFGAPSMSEPWGWQLFGHHLCLSCFILGTQMVLSPAFWGAEPSYADVGPFAGTRLFEDEERAGLTLIRALDDGQRAKAIVAHSMVGGDLPEGRRHFADNLHLGGAYQDNRIVPYEGIAGSALTPAQRRSLLDLVANYITRLPDGPSAAQMADIERHMAETRFCWIGGFAEDSAFYYRIQSPVVMIEFDHHRGVFLTNDAPAKFHVHTIVRTPNGNDYGIDLLRLHYANAPHHRQHHAHDTSTR